MGITDELGISKKVKIGNTEYQIRGISIRRLCDLEDQIRAQKIKIAKLISDEAITAAVIGAITADEKKNFLSTTLGSVWYVWACLDTHQTFEDFMDNISTQEFQELDKIIAADNELSGSKDSKN